MAEFCLSRDGIRKLVANMAERTLDDALPHEPKSRRMAIAQDIANACATLLVGVVREVPDSAITTDVKLQ